MAEHGLDQIGQISIAVHDLDRAVAFYRDTLKLPLLFQAPPGMAFFDCGGVRLMLTLPMGDSGDHATSNIYYKVTNIQETAAVLAARGVEFEREPHRVAKLPEHELWMAFFRDPDGNLLALMSEIAANPPDLP